MPVLGIIAEYNPFHNGHLYHLEQSKKLTGADTIVCVMSGNFIQRGEPAVTDKWARAEMALRGGVDLVIELPVVYAMASAEYFAFGGVKLLDSLGLVDYLSFGSEAGNLGSLEAAAEILLKEPEGYKGELKEALNRGLSYPAAREYALCKHTAAESPNSMEFTEPDKENEASGRPGSAGNIGHLLGGSNNILGIEYLKALKRLNSRIRPVTIPRVSNRYNSEEITGSITSATAVRKLILDHSPGMGLNLCPDSLRKALDLIVPSTTATILVKEFQAGRGPIFPTHFESLLLSSIRRMSPEAIAALPYVAEGLENRIKEAGENTGSLQLLIESICTKRYTRTRIQRILFHLLTNLTADELEQFGNAGGPQYIRVLGFNSRGRELLAEINRKSSLPVITKTADFKQHPDPLLRRMLAIEAAATDQYVLTCPSPKFRSGGQEFTRGVIRIS